MIEVTTNLVKSNKRHNIKFKAINYIFDGNVYFIDFGGWWNTYPRQIIKKIRRKRICTL